ncbi:methyl-accepting chemotaxis protein [Methanoregula sp.]|uniref:methyl-accepting chemotaxis protein n=1 Tax=Methanoregula sp. TaxID=2052170 RepID=UPI002371EF74|nr:methyl-accepting chemotaxis protein [Methanoregula sp.]MDD1685775.1 methyl-accepting chemotaxis protein [Methanoregula sp.]
MVDVNEFNEMFERNPLAQVLIDADLKIQLVNEAFTKLVGFSKDRLLAIRISDLRSQNMIKYLKDSGQTIQDAITTKRVSHGESTIDTPSGMHVIVRANIPLMDEKGNVKYVYVTYNEITKIVKSQQFMEKQVDALSQGYAKMAAGDLTIRLQLQEPDEDTKDVNTQIIKLRDAVRGIVISLEKNIGDVNKQMLNLTSTADNASKSVEDASKSVNQIAKNAGVVSENAQKSSEGIEQMSKAMQDMSAAVEEITSSMESVSSQANTAKDSARTGAVLAENVNKDMMDITTQSGVTYEVIKEIEKQMTDIGKIIVLIRDLASQTNLLALNAAIEAARAGEHGRGFAVVASEVKSLAQESRSSAEKIEEMITQLNIATKKAADGMEGAQVLVKKGVEESKQALEAFKTIQKAAEAVANSASEVAAATEEQAATTEEITASVHEVASLIERTAKESGDTAAATEESAAAIDEITRMIQTVNDVAVEAMEANKKFKVE